MFGDVFRLILSVLQLIIVSDAAIILGEIMQQWNHCPPTDFMRPASAG